MSNKLISSLSSPEHNTRRAVSLEGRKEGRKEGWRDGAFKSGHVIVIRNFSGCRLSRHSFIRSGLHRIPPIKNSNCSQQKAKVIRWLFWAAREYAGNRAEKGFDMAVGCQHIPRFYSRYSKELRMSPIEVKNGLLLLTLVCKFNLLNSLQEIACILAR